MQRQFCIFCFCLQWQDIQFIVFVFFRQFVLRLLEGFLQEGVCVGIIVRFLVLFEVGFLVFWFFRQLLRGVIIVLVVLIYFVGLELQFSIYRFLRFRFIEQNCFRSYLEGEKFEVRVIFLIRVRLGEDISRQCWVQGGLRFCFCFLEFNVFVFNFNYIRGGFYFLICRGVVVCKVFFIN